MSERAHDFIKAIVKETLVQHHSPSILLNSSEQLSTVDPQINSRSLEITINFGLSVIRILPDAKIPDELMSEFFVMDNGLPLKVREWEYDGWRLSLNEWLSHWVSELQETTDRVVGLDSRSLRSPLFNDSDFWFGDFEDAFRSDLDSIVDAMSAHHQDEYTADVTGIGFESIEQVSRLDIDLEVKNRNGVFKATAYMSNGDFKLGEIEVYNSNQPSLYTLFSKNGYTARRCFEKLLHDICRTFEQTEMLRVVPINHLPTHALVSLKKTARYVLDTVRNEGLYLEKMSMSSSNLVVRGSGENTTFKSLIFPSTCIEHEFVENKNGMVHADRVSSEKNVFVPMNQLLNGLPENGFIFAIEHLLSKETLELGILAVTDELKKRKPFIGRGFSDFVV